MNALLLVLALASATVAQNASSDAERLSVAEPSRQEAELHESRKRRDQQALAKLAGSPTRSDLRQIKILDRKLVSDLSARLPAADLKALGKALKSYADTPDLPPMRRLRPLVEWQEKQPKNEFSLTVGLGISTVAVKTGDFKLALKTLDHLSARLKDLDSSETSRESAEKVIVAQADFYRRLGMKQRLEQLLESVEGRRPHLVSAQALIEARLAVETWSVNPMESLQCGLMAHNVIAAMTGQKLISRYDPDARPEDGQAAAWGIDLGKEKLAELIEHGLSGAMLQARIEQSNPGWRWLRRTSGVDVPAPSVAHLILEGRVGHYTAVTGSDGSQVKVEDVYLQMNGAVEADVFAAQCSGYFLVPPGVEVGAEFVEAGTQEVEQFFGRGSCPSLRDPEGGNEEDKCKKPNCDGMPVPYFDSFMAFLRLIDRPLTYQPAFGPGVDLAIQYFHRDFTEDSVLEDTGSLGPNWSHGLLSYMVAENGAVLNASTTQPVKWVHDGSFTTYKKSGTTYQRRYAERPILTWMSTSPAGFRLTFPEGDQYDFTRPNLTSGPTRYYLSKIRNVAGQEVVVSYINDTTNRIDYVTDAAGKVTKFLYSPTDSPNLIRHIVTEYSHPVGPSEPQPNTTEIASILAEPQHRHASFSYNGSRVLDGITDCLGLQSTFSYADQIDPTKVTKLTTPYGDTHFELTGYPSMGYASWWALSSTDPAGLVRRIESVYHDYNTSFSNGPKREKRPGSSVLDGGVPLTNGDIKIYAGSIAYDFLSEESNWAYHNHTTFEWNAKQWREYQKALGDARVQDPDASLDPRPFAEVIVWAMDGPSSRTTSVPLIRKTPGMSAEHYNFKQQTDPFFNGLQYSAAPGARSPAKTVRRVEGNAPNTAPVWAMTQQLPTHSAAGLLLSKIEIDEMGRQKNYTYDSNGNTLTVKSSTVSLQTMTYEFGMPDSVTALSGAKWEVTDRDTNSKQPTEIEVKNGTTILHRYSLSYEAGRLIKVERSPASALTPVVTVAQATYDAFGRIATHTDEVGQVRSFTYDKMDRVKLITYTGNMQNGQTTTEVFEYHLLDLQSHKDRAGHWTHTIHDKVRRPIMTIAPNNKVTNYEWCSCGSLYKLIDPAGRVTEWKRDILGRVTEKIMPDGVSKTTYTYWDWSGLLKSISRPKDQPPANSPPNTAPTTTVTFYYNPDGSLRLEDYTDSDTPDATYHYTTTLPGTVPDPLGRLTFVQDLAGTHTLSYAALTAGTNGAGSLQFYKGPFTNDALQYTYDDLDRVWKEHLGADAATAAAPITDTAATRFEIYARDKLERLTSVTNALGTQSLSYNTLLSRPDSITGPNSLTTTLTYKADSDGMAARQLASLTHSRSGTSMASHLYGYDPAGRISAWERGGSLQPGIKNHYAHNLSNELTHEQTTLPGSTQLIDSSTWAYDDAGNWLSKTRLNDHTLQTRTHDTGKMNRLTGMGGTGSTVIEGTVNEWAQVSVTPNGGTAQAASLMRDPTGTGYRYRAVVPVNAGTNTLNVTATDQSSPGQSSQTTNQSWEFEVPAQSRSLTYDLNGNLLNDGAGRTYTWDAKNRLRTVTRGGTTWKWDYDWMDRRVKEYENNVHTKIYIWSGTQLVQVRNAANVIVRTYHDGGWVEGAAGSTTSAAKFYTLKDHLGSVRQVVDSTGAVRARHDYDAYGAQVEAITQPPQAALLQAWLRADVGVIKDGTNKVTEWRSHSTSGNGFAEVTSPSTSARPLWVDATLNGRPVVRFDGTDDLLQGNSGFSSLTEDFTVFVVHRRSNTATGGSPFNFGNTAATGPGQLTLAWQNAWTSPNQTLTSGMGLGAETTSPWHGMPRVETAPDAAGAWQISTVVKSGTSWIGEPFDNGSQIRSDLLLRNQSSSHARHDIKTASTQTYTGVDHNGYGLGRGILDGNGVPLGYLQGDVAEVLVYFGALSAAEQQQVEEYLGRRHGLVHDKPSDFRFTGHHYHEGSGLHLALYRAYDGELGRWLNEDPIGEEGGLNLYGYVGNSPLMRIDPLGLRPLTDCEKKTLAPFIPKIDLDNADLHDGVTPAYLLKKMDGITRGNKIYFRPGVYNSNTADGMAVLAHELVHVGQYRTGMNAAKYLGASALRGYRNNKYEKPAYAMQRKVLNELNLKGFKGCPP